MKHQCPKCGEKYDVPQGIILKWIAHSRSLRRKAADVINKIEESKSHEK